MYRTWGRAALPWVRALAPYASMASRAYSSRGSRQQYKRGTYTVDARGRRWPKRVATTAAMGSTRRRGPRDVNPRQGGYVGFETKFKDFEASGTIANTITGSEIDPGSSVNCISAVAQGDGESERTGRRIVLKSLEIRGTIILPDRDAQAVMDVGKTVRFLVVLDKQTNAAQLNAEDVLTDNSLFDVNAMVNLEYRNRFTVLADKLFQLDYLSGASDGAAVTSQGGQTKSFKLYIPLGNLPVNFTGTTAVVASVVDNSLHCIAISTGTTCTYSYCARIRYVG